MYSQTELQVEVGDTITTTTGIKGKATKGTSFGRIAVGFDTGHYATFDLTGKLLGVQNWGNNFVGKGAEIIGDIYRIEHIVSHNAPLSSGTVVNVSVDGVVTVNAVVLQVKGDKALCAHTVYRGHVETELAVYDVDALKPVIPFEQKNTEEIDNILRHIDKADLVDLVINNWERMEFPVF